MSGKKNKKKSSKKASGKKRKADDPNYVRRAYTPFLCFSMVTRPLMRQDNPAASFADLAKMLGDRWKSLTPEEKQPHVAASELDAEKLRAIKRARTAAAAPPPPPDVKQQPQAMPRYQAVVAPPPLPPPPLPQIGVAAVHPMARALQLTDAAYWKQQSAADRVKWMTTSSDCAALSVEQQQWFLDQHAILLSLETTPTLQHSPAPAPPLASSNNSNSHSAAKPESGRTGRECAVCLDSAACVAFVECRHVVCCKECAKQVVACPTCRQAPITIMELFFATA
jgi:hypothetical protein